MINKYWVVIALMAGCSALQAETITTIDLTEKTGYPPYVTAAYDHFMVASPEYANMGHTAILFDVDGDGYRDLIAGRPHYVAAVGVTAANPVTYYQTNLDPEFCTGSKTSFTMSDPMDLDGDGAPELVITGQKEGKWEWRFWVMDPRTGQILNHFDLPGGEEIRQDNLWDGYYTVSGALDCLVDGVKRRAIILTVNVGFDLEGRGIMALDPWTGEILWHFRTGPNPLPESTRVLDLDGDGAREVVVFGRAPDNLNGRTINGFTDNESRLFVLDNQGALRWTEHLGDAYGGGYLITADLDGDGHPEIITSTFTMPEVWGEAVVWKYDGQRLASFGTSDQFNQFVLLPPDENGIRPLAVTASSGRIRILEFRPPDLVQTGEVQTGSYPYINGVVDLPAHEGPEVIISTQNGTLWVLDRKLKVLAQETGRHAQGWRTPMEVWEVSPGETLLMSMKFQAPPLLLLDAPRNRTQARAALGAGVVVLALALLIIARRRFTTEKTADPVIQRATRLGLLEDLEISGHGAIAPLKSVRRLVWHLNALGSGLGDEENIRSRLQDARTECLDEALPLLEGILNRSQEAGISSVNIGYTARSLQQVRTQLQILETTDFRDIEIIGIADDIKTATGRAEEALKELRAEVASYFRTDLIETLTRVLAANVIGLEEFGITVRTGLLSQAHGGVDDFRIQNPDQSLQCLIDPQECAFVLDNLVGNSVRAMRTAAKRSLRITWSIVDGMVQIDVSDSGEGIPKEDWNRIMNTRFSTRDGGGSGLPTTRRILRKYGGSLNLVDSQVGHGTTFRMTLPRV